MTKQIVIDGVEMTLAAAQFVAECGVDVAGDVRSLRAGRSTRDALLVACLDGADADRAEGIRDYVAAVSLATGSV